MPLFVSPIQRARFLPPNKRIDFVSMTLSLKFIETFGYLPHLMAKFTRHYRLKCLNIVVIEWKFSVSKHSK